MPGFDPSLPSLDEAVRAWLIAQIVANLDTLNMALQRDSLTQIGPITAAMVIYGDPQTLPDVSLAPILITVQGGGRMDSMDMECEQQFIGGGSIPYHHDVHSSIHVYIHPDALPTPADNALESGRERTLARVCDWLRAAVFNTTQNATAVLTSREFAVAPGYDVLDRAHIASIEKSWAYKQFAGSQAVYHAHLRHTGEVTGTSYWTP